MERIYQILILTAVLFAAFGLYAAYPSLTGEEVILQLAPVDPTDIFYGEYMTVRYDISTVNAALPADTPIAVGDTIYVALSADPISAPLAYTHAKPDSLFIKGEVENSWNGQSIAFGIEKFYIAEGSGTRVAGTNYTALVKIDGAGRATIKEIRKDGVKVDFKYDRDARNSW